MKMTSVWVIIGVVVLTGIYLGGYSESSEDTVSGVTSTKSEINEPIATPKAASNYVSTDDRKQPSADALETSAHFYVYIDKNSLEAKNKFLNKFSEGTNDVKKAIINYAIMLDENPDIMSNVKSLVGISSNQNQDYYSEGQIEEASPLPAQGTNDYSNNPRLNNQDTSPNNNSGSNKSLQYNPYSSSWEYAGDDENLKYNAFEDQWEYASDDETTKYNAFEDRWEYAGKNESTKYNAFEDTWEYAPADSTTKYNSFENKWETTSPDSELKYNPFSNSWSYE